MIIKPIPELEQIPKLKSKTLPGIRLYQLPNERWVPSVTSVLGWRKRDFFREWRCKVGPQVAQEGAKRGQHMHDLVEAKLEGKDTSKVEAQNPLAGIVGKKLFKTIEPALEAVEILHVLEQPLYSEVMTLAGRCDAVVTADGHLEVWDFKTAKEPKPEKWLLDYYLQVTAYILMIQEITGLDIQRGRVIVSCENGKVQVKKIHYKDYENTLAEEILGYYADLQERLKNGKQ